MNDQAETKATEVPNVTDLNFNMTLAIRVNMKDDDPRIREIWCGEPFMLYLDNQIGVTLFDMIKKWTQDRYPGVEMTVTPKVDPKLVGMAEGNA